ncbi:MAG TPA: PhzF family phenazine biosynthesis protein, partial [Syntrophobacteria bacterium]|nr:PhzF family phenazine biosynthesis protein [Syntrophobacteria bacterium]
MGIRIYQVDAFTNRPFAGNPAGVCILPGPVEAEWMQKIAREMNLSETAFLWRLEDGFSLRWFTPAVEVELCGHATLASAHILWETRTLARRHEARFHTLSGLLTATRGVDGIEMNFPATPEDPAAILPELIQSLGVEPRYVGRSIFDYLVEVGSEAEVKDLKPDFVLLRQIPIRGVMVTSRASSPGFDFVSRFFAPSVGIDEDPVTGSAHCCLGPYWADKLGKEEMVAYQASARGGTLRVRVDDDRVYIGGQAVTVLRG